LQAHVEKLPAAISYLENFPIDVADTFPRGVVRDRSEELKRRARTSWHRYFLNPMKSASLRKYFEKNKTGVVLAEYGITGVGTLKLCKEFGLPLVVHFHGYDAYSKEIIERYQESYRKLFAYASAIIGVSKHMVGQLKSLGAPSEKLFYNPYGVDLIKFKQASPDRAPMQVIAVGRFVEKKAPYLTILAFQKVLERLPEARLVMVGTGILHDVCSRLVKSLRIEHAVQLKGVVDHDRVAALMQQSRVFVQHSLTPASGDAEGTPVAILETGASGLPVVSTRHGGITDAVIEGKTGFLVNEGDIEAMADSIYQLLSSPALAGEMGNNAREYIGKHFNMDRSITHLRQILESYSL
jgi:glycosyltransferase involved in cell wall biosynthesis